MSGYLRTFKRMLVDLWHRIAPPAKKVRPAEVDIADHSFHFKGAILDNLDRYFHYLKKMRASDPDAYGLMGKTGLHIFPFEKLLYTTPQTPFLFRHWRPAFGGVLLHDTHSEPDNAKFLHAKFIYIMKKASPFDAHGASLYEMTVFYTDDTKPARRYGFMGTCQVVISPQGEITLLKARGTDTIDVKVNKHSSRDRRFSIPSMRLDYPEFFKDLARQHNESPQNIAARMFAIVATAQEDAALANARVMVNKGDAAAAFNINIKRTAYFFRDRSTTALAADGRRKRIFHIVRAHERHTQRKVVDVKFHFRGMRLFDWNGYSVVVSVPGLHHEPLAIFESGFEAHDPKKPFPRDMLTSSEAGQRIADRLRR